MSAPARIAAFLLASAALIALAVALAPADPAPVPPPLPRAGPARGTAPSSELIEIAARRRASLHKAASALIGAVLRYEVGDLPPSVTRAMRRLATAGFARQLLADPPRRVAGSGAARIVKVETGFLSRGLDRALVRGVARRADGPEELAFVFVLREGRWLAAGAAE